MTPASRAAFRASSVTAAADSLKAGVMPLVWNHLTPVKTRFQSDFAGLDGADSRNPRGRRGRSSGAGAAPNSTKYKPSLSASDQITLLVSTPAWRARFSSSRPSAFLGSRETHALLSPGGPRRRQRSAHRRPPGRRVKMSARGAENRAAPDESWPRQKSPRRTSMAPSHPQLTQERIADCADFTDQEFPRWRRDAGICRVGIRRTAQIAEGERRWRSVRILICVICEICGFESSYSTVALRDLSIVRSVLHPALASSWRRLSVQMGWDTPP